MTNPAQEQPGADPTHDFPPLHPSDFGRGYLSENPSPRRGHSIGFFLSGFSTGFLAAILLSTLGYFLVIKPQSQNAIGQINSNQSVSISPKSQPQSAAISSSSGTTAPSQSQSFVSSSESVAASSSEPSRSFSSGIVPHHSFSGLNLEESHPNGTVLRVDGVAFNADTIAVQLAVTNSHHGKIKLNELWATSESTMILEDNLGNAYRVAPPPENREIEVEPGTTAQGEFIFLGKVGPSTKSLTLTTNSIAGLPHNSITYKPKISIHIPLDQLIKDQ